MNVCPKCQSESGPGALVCPACGALVHGPELKRLYAESREAEQTGDWARSLDCLQRCLELLPARSKQFRQVQAQVRRVSHLYSSQPPSIDPDSLESPDPLLAGASDARGGNGEAGELAAGPPRGWVALPVCLVRAIAILVRGLTRPRTLISMVVWVVLLSFLIGWREAAGFAVMIYFHEMGHVLAIQFFGMRFAWPFFVPFLGAFVLHGKGSGKARQNALISLSGPLTGILLSSALYGLHRVVPLPDWLVQLVRINALINVLNLLPFWILDGGRIADCATRRQTAAFALVLLALACLPFNPFTLLIGLLFAVRALLFDQFRKTAKLKVSDTSRMGFPTILTAATVHVGCLLFVLLEQ